MNFLRQIASNLLKGPVPAGDAADGGGGKRWKDIWSAGQGVTQVTEVKPVAQIVEDVVREYHDAVARLTA